MKRIVKCEVFFVAVMLMASICLTAGNTLAQGKAAEPSQVKGYVKKAAAYAKEVGCEKAFAEFNQQKSVWNTTYNNMFVTAVDRDGLMYAHGQYPNLVNQNLLAVKDADGKMFLKETIEKCKKSTYCDNDFTWMITKTNKKEPRGHAFEVTDCNGKKIMIGVIYQGKMF